MHTYQFLNKSDDGRILKWCTTNTVKEFINFIQYLLDNCSNPDAYIVYDKTAGKTYDFHKLVEYLGMRKRDFTERMEDIETHNLATEA